jgi:PilZ domain
MDDRRFEKRHAVREPVEISWASDLGDQSSDATLSDLSRSGARIRLNRAIKLGSELQIEIRGASLKGTVMSCAREGPAFKVGVEFHPDSQGIVKPNTEPVAHP